MANLNDKRQDRLRAALRNNLRNRKAQQRRLEGDPQGEVEHRLRKRGMDITRDDKKDG